MLLHDDVHDDVDVQLVSYVCLDFAVCELICNFNKIQFNCLLFIFYLYLKLLHCDDVINLDLQQVSCVKRIFS